MSYQRVTFPHGVNKCLTCSVRKLKCCYKMYQTEKLSAEAVRYDRVKWRNAHFITRSLPLDVYKPHWVTTIVSGNAFVLLLFKKRVIWPLFFSLACTLFHSGLRSGFKSHNQSSSMWPGRDRVCGIHQYADCTKTLLSAGIEHVYDLMDMFMTC